MPPPGVPHAHGDRHAVARHPLRADVHDHLAGLGEFHRVGEQVEQDLAHAVLVRPDRRRHIGVDQVPHLQALAHGLLRHRVEGVLDAVADAEVHRRQVHHAALDPGVIQHVADQAEQRRGAAPQHVHEVTLVRRQVRRLQQVRDADDAVEGRAQLVAHRRQEVALGSGRHFGRLFGAPQFLLRAAPPGQVRDVDGPDLLAPGPVRDGGQFDGELGPVAARRERLDAEGGRPEALLGPGHDGREFPAAVARQDHRLERDAEGIGPAEPEHALGGFVDLDDAPRRVGADNRVGHGLQDAALVRFAPEEAFERRAPVDEIDAHRGAEHGGQHQDGEADGGRVRPRLRRRPPDPARPRRTRP